MDNLTERTSSVEGDCTSRSDTGLFTRGKFAAAARWLRDIRQAPCLFHS
jgi:hypothetical protein